MQQERKIFKNKTKNINIKLKAIEERVSKLKIEELNFEKQKSETVRKRQPDNNQGWIHIIVLPLHTTRKRAPSGNGKCKCENH